MDKKDFNKIRSQVSKMTDEEKDELLSYLNNEEDNMAMQVVESILNLVGSNTELVEEYGVYINEYYKLPFKNRRTICKDSYTKFLKNGNFDITSICMLIACEAEHVEEKVDPVVEAIREACVLIKENPKINTTGIRYE